MENRAESQFKFAEFQTKLFIEGVEVAVDTFSVRYLENEPSTLSATIPLSKNSSEFITNVLRNRPVVVLTAKATGESYNEDWHVLFVGYVTTYGVSIGTSNATLNISAVDFLGLLKETIMYNINPAIRWLDVVSLYTSGVTI